MIPGWGAKIPHTSGPKNQNIKQKQYYNKFNKDLKKWSIFLKNLKKAPPNQLMIILEKHFISYVSVRERASLDSSVGKESACNAGDPGSILGSGRSAGERIGYPLQYSWASLMTQLVKNPPAMWETWVQSLGWEDPLDKGKATHSSTLAWRIPWPV